MHIVIVGAGYAGLSCALRLARKAPHADITLVNASPHFVERIRLHERTAGKAPRVWPLAELVQGTRIRLCIGWLQRLDLEERTLEVDGERVSWDKLVLALGSHTDVESVPGVREHAFTLDAASSAWLASLLPALAARGGRVVVVGGGLTGIEVATEIAESHPVLRVTLASRGELAAGFAPVARSHVREATRRLGIEVREQLAIEAVHARELVTPGERIPFDACVWSAGFLAPALDAAFSYNERRQIWVDRYLRALSHKDVYVAGDLAVLAEVRGAPMPMGCKTALPSGLHAADNLARNLRGQPERAFAYRAVPYCLSLGRRDALLVFSNGRRTYGGKLVAAVKELICRATVWSLQLERRRANPLPLFASRPKALLGDSVRS